MQLPLFLLPISALVKAELLRTLRLKRAYILLLLVTGTVMIYMASQAPSLYGNRVNMSHYASLARAIFNFIMFIHLIVAALIIPPMGAMALAGEREKETYDQLSLTLIRVPSLIIGKMLNILGFYALLVLSTLPVVGIIFFYVGVDTLQFIQALGLIAVTSLSLCAAGFSVSTSKSESRRTIIISYAQMFVVFGLPYFVLAALFFAINLGDITSTIMHYPQFWCPLFSMGNVLSSAVSLNEYLSMLGYQLFVALCFVSLAILPLRYQSHKRRRQARSSNRKSRIKEYSKPLIIPDGANPVYCKDVHTARAQNWRVYRIQYGLIFWLSLVINFFIAAEGPEYFIVVYFGLVLLFTLYFISAISNVMVKEWEKDTADLLRGTVLRADLVFNAKIKSELRLMASMVLASIPGLLIGLTTFIANNELGYLLVSSVYLGLGFIYSALIAIFISVGRKSTSTAAVSAILANVVMQVLMPIMVVLITDGEGLGLVPCPFLFAAIALTGEISGDSTLTTYAILNFITVMIAIPIIYAMAIYFFEERFLRRALPSMSAGEK